MLEKFVRKLYERMEEKGAREEFEKKRPINVPPESIIAAPLTKRELDEEFEARFNRVDRELRSGLNFIRKHKRSVTFFGSTRFSEDNQYYQMARRIAKRVVAGGYDVITGGGPGVMEAANRGAWEANGPKHSVGFTIELPHEQVSNPYVDDKIGFYYFFTRKVSLTFAAEAYIFFPGGFGTLDEFFEILTLVQTRKIEKVPIILVGNEFWSRLEKFFDEMLLEKYKTIDPENKRLYTITEDEDEIVEIVKNAPLRLE